VHAGKIWIDDATWKDGRARSRHGEPSYGVDAEAAANHPYGRSRGSSVNGWDVGGNIPRRPELSARKLIIARRGEGNIYMKNQCGDVSVFLYKHLPSTDN
jgi:hypothetical protein